MKDLLVRNIGEVLIRVGTPVENCRINDIPSPSNGTNDSCLLPGMQENGTEYGSTTRNGIKTQHTTRQNLNLTRDASFENSFASPEPYENS